jgi:hypothetical protein
VSSNPLFSASPYTFQINNLCLGYYKIAKERKIERERKEGEKDKKTTLHSHDRRGTVPAHNNTTKKYTHTDTYTQSIYQRKRELSLTTTARVKYPIS